MRQQPFQFGSFTLDPGQRRLTDAGAQVELNARYFDALHLMVAEAGSLVTKDRFNAEVWRGVPVTDEALTQCIKALRRALGDDAARPRFIETVPKHGYRFIAPVDGPKAAVVARPGLAASAVDAAAGGVGGGLAGVVGGIIYVAAGLVAPGLGSASIAMALISLCLGLGLAGGSAIALGIVATGGAKGGIARAMAGGGAGGLAIGLLATVVGRDLFSLLFGKVPESFTGGFEGAMLGVTLGAAAWLARRAAGGPLRKIAPAIVMGAATGLIIALAGGRLMAGSLAELGRSFPESPLRFHTLSQPLLAAATALEAGLFCAFVTAALIIARRLRED